MTMYVETVNLNEVTLLTEEEMKGIKAGTYDATCSWHDTYFQCEGLCGHLAAGSEFDGGLQQWADEHGWSITGSIVSCKVVWVATIGYDCGCPINPPWTYL